MKCRTGEPGCCNKVANAQAKNMYRLNSPASIRYSGQWRPTVPSTLNARDVESVESRVTHAVLARILIEKRRYESRIEYVELPRLCHPRTGMPGSAVIAAAMTVGCRQLDLGYAAINEKLI